jgi:acyl-CoA synthetase (AMP-forming)/AMP-acid ligase II
MSPTTASGSASLLQRIDNLADLLLPHVRERPGNIAVGTSDLKLVLSYRQLDDLATSAAAQMALLNARSGDLIALVCDNSVEFVVALLALQKAGAIAAPVNPASNASELRARFAQLPVRAVLAPPQHAAEADLCASAAGCPHRWLLGIEGSGSTARASVSSVSAPATDSFAVPPSDPIDGDVALIMFTAGSSSAPKAVPLTHQNLAASIHGIATAYDLSAQDVTLVVMPLFHGHGLVAGLLATLASGGTAYLPSTGSFSAHGFWPDMARVRASWYTAVPTIHRILVNRAAQEYPHSSPLALRFIRSCSAPLDMDLVTAVADTFHAPMISAYGMTETAHQAASNPLPLHGANKTHSVGLPTGVEVRITGSRGANARAGEVGEICVRGPALTGGYLNNPEANAEAFVDGWFRTGDLGSLDEDGYLVLKGRLKELINRGGEKISPGDVDAALLSSPKVFEAASFGEPDEIYGEVVQAAVILRPGVSATEDELRDHCRAALVAYEVPERIHILSHFPRTAKGSIDRKALAGLFAP